MEREKDTNTKPVRRRRKAVDLSDFTVTVEYAKPSPDDEMTPEQRLDAIAELLATAVLRMHRAEQKMKAELEAAQVETKAPEQIGSSEWNFILSE